MLDLRHGTVVRTLIPKIAEGIFNVMCKFNEGNFLGFKQFLQCSLLEIHAYSYVLCKSYGLDKIHILKLFE